MPGLFISSAGHLSLALDLNIPFWAVKAVEVADVDDNVYFDKPEE